MAYDLTLEARIDKLAGRWKGFIKKKMFGGVGYMLNGNMCFGIHKDSLMIRVVPESTGTLLRDKHIKPFDITGKPMKGWLLVSKNGFATEEELSSWLKMSKEFVSGLPKKD